MRCERATRDKSSPGGIPHSVWDMPRYIFKKVWKWEAFCGIFSLSDIYGVFEAVTAITKGEALRDTEPVE